MKLLATRKRRVVGAAAIIIIAASVFVGQWIHTAHWPVRVDPSPDWETMISKLNVQREQFFVRAGEVRLEAELLIPIGGAERKGAVVFSPGSSDSLCQNYAKGLIESYVFDVFLRHDMAVLLVNKRGMGKSEGNWVKNDFQGRADDLYASVQHLQNHHAIDPDRVGLIGHSQGGWIVNLTASQHEDVAFFISLVGPVTTVEEQIEDIYENELRCQGYDGDELAQRTEDELDWTRLGVSIGKTTSFGMFGFDARIFKYDPRQALQAVRCPGLFVYGEHDRLVPADANVTRFNSIVQDPSARQLSVVTIPKANHCFRVTDGLCSAVLDSTEFPLSRELVTVLDEWLTENSF